MIIDVAYHDGLIDWPRAKAGGVTEAYIRFGTGARWGMGDPLVLANIINALKAELPIAPYVVPALSEGDMKYQAQVYVANIKALISIGYQVDSVKRPPAGDWERFSLSSRKLNRDGVRVWTGEVSSALGFMPAAYTNAHWWNTWIVDAGIEHTLPLWIANYTLAPAPTIPLAWSKRGLTWYLWQYGDKGSIAGIPSSVDLNRRPTA